jgi:hypothetical protein
VSAGVHIYSCPAHLYPRLTSSSFPLMWCFTTHLHSCSISALFLPNTRHHLASIQIRNIPNASQTMGQVNFLSGYQHSFDFPASMQSLTSPTLSISSKTSPLWPHVGFYPLRDPKHNRLTASTVRSFRNLTQRSVVGYG